MFRGGVWGAGNIIRCSDESIHGSYINDIPSTFSDTKISMTTLASFPSAKEGTLNSLLLQHSSHLRPLTPPNPIQIDINNLRPIRLRALSRRLPRASNPSNIHSNIESPKPLDSLRNAALDGVLVTNIQFQRFDLHVRELGFDGARGSEQLAAIDICERETFDAVFCERKSCCLADSWSEVRRCVDIGGESAVEPEAAPVMNADPFSNVAILLCYSSMEEVKCWDTNIAISIENLFCFHSIITSMVRLCLV